MDSKIEITRCPSLLLDGYDSYSPRALRDLFDGKNVSPILKFPSPSSPDQPGAEFVRNAGRLSLSGAQSKFGMTIDEASSLQYSPKDLQSSFILKPKPIGYHIINPQYCAANENLTMQIASQIYGIETAPNGLCFFQDGEVAYLTRRFDVSGEEKYPQEDFASLMGLSRANGGSDFKYINGSYEECGDIIKKYVKAYTIDLLRFLRLLLFNFITLNDDAHLKNFSLIKKKGEYRLSPAYDLINTAMQLYEPRIFALERGLFKEGMYLCDTRQVRSSDFMELGHRWGLPEKLVLQEIRRFTMPNKNADDLIDRSFLSKDLKESYKSSMHYRQSMIRPS